MSWVAIAPDGLVYELQRGAKANPILVLDSRGNLIRSWGAGDFVIPHSIRLDPSGNVWAVDASSSKVFKYSPQGSKLLTIEVGGQPHNGSPYAGATDIAFAPNGHVFITDGYGNSRVLEYSARGRRLRQWGKHGSGPGRFNLPHAIQIGKDGTVYVADRENGRIEKFDQHGHYLGEFAGFSRVYSMKLARDAIWATIGDKSAPPGDPPGWIVKIDLTTGKILGHLEIKEPRAGHAIDLSSDGSPIVTAGTELLWFSP